MRFRAVLDDRLHLGLMLVLTFSTGIIDAVGYLTRDLGSRPMVIDDESYRLCLVLLGKSTAC